MNTVTAVAPGSEGLLTSELVLLCLLAAGLNPAESIVCPELEHADAAKWKTIFRTASKQGVLAIVYDAVVRLPHEQQPPKEVLLPWAVNTDKIEHAFAHRLDALEGLTAFYTKHSIRVLLLKGAGLASYYPTPSHRPCGDIDIYLYGRQREADTLMRTELNTAISNDTHHHTVFFFRGVMVENHYDFLNLTSQRSNRRIEADLLQLAGESGTTFTVGQQQVTLPSPNFNALYLMRHMASHFAAVEIGLRHIADWAAFLQAEGKRVDWPRIRAIYRRERMERFADAVTGICVERLGVPRQQAYDYVRNDVLQETLLRETFRPAFSEVHPHAGLVVAGWFKLRRWWANRWKHRLVYRDSLLGSFLWLCWSHLTHPKTITKVK